jgi:citrate/tricarballylate utilization protein
LHPKAFLNALNDSARLKYLGGGGGGCVSSGDQPSNRRRVYHHAVFYGFLLCFAATSVATLYHYAFDVQAPYRRFDLPVLLGTAGGIGIVVGTLGLAREKTKGDLAQQGDAGLGTPFLVVLGLTAASGLALLFLRHTPAMGMLLAGHLGLVFGLFLTLPYGKFVHGFFRLASLIRYADEH